MAESWAEVVEDIGGVVAMGNDKLWVLLETVGELEAYARYTAAKLDFNTASKRCGDRSLSPSKRADFCRSAEGHKRRMIAWQRLMKTNYGMAA